MIGEGGFKDRLERIEALEQLIPSEGSQGPQGEQGIQGEKGDQGDPGADGDDGPSVLEVNALIAAYLLANPPSGSAGFTVWAEENSPLSANTEEWAFGNGANIPIGQGTILPNCELYGAGLSLRQGAASVGVYINSSLVGSVSNLNAIGGDVKRCYIEFPTPVLITAGSVVSFRTLTAAGTSTPNVVTALFR